MSTTTSQHTPGPWLATLGEIIDGRRRYFPLVRIPDCHGGHDHIIVNAGGWDMATHDANARLIAAAPDLLEALQWMEATAVNLHCALQATAGMDRNDRRVSVITGEVVGDLLVMRNRARNAIALATNSRPAPGLPEAGQGKRQ